MTLPTKILLAMLVIAGSSVYAGGVTGKETEAAQFVPAEVPSRGPALQYVTDEDQAPIALGPEIADNQTEGGTCQIQCHPAFNYSAKTALARFDLKKIK